MTALVRSHPNATLVAGFGVVGATAGVLIGRHNGHQRERAATMDQPAEQAAAAQYLARMDTDLGLHRTADGGGLTVDEGFKVLDYTKRAQARPPQLVKIAQDGPHLPEHDYQPPVSKIRVGSRQERIDDVALQPLVGQMFSIAAPIAAVGLGTVALSRTRLANPLATVLVSFGAAGTAMAAATAASSKLTYGS